MFKTIFSKMFTIFILILIIAFSITGVMLNFFLDGFFTDEKAKTMESVSTFVNMAFSNYLDVYDTSQKANNSRVEKFLNDSLAFYGRYTDSIIWIAENGHVVRSSTEMPLSVFNKYSDNSGYIKIPESKILEKLKTEGVSVKDIGDFNGFFKDPSFVRYGDLWLTVAKSFRYQSTNGKDLLVTVYMHTPVPMVKKLRYTVIQYFLISVLAAVIIAFLLWYIFSRRLSKPLKQIKNAAARISNGEFGKRLDIKSRDEIGELAKTFNQMAAALQNLEEMRRGFIANVSHELRTPMTSIRGFIEGILDGTIPPERQSHYLTIVKDETIRLNRLVNDLLDLAKMEAGELKLSIMPVDINELLRKCVINLETLLLEKNLSVDADFEEEDLLVRADADAIERVVINLMHNAIKFTPPGGNIKLMTAAQKDNVEVTVKDNGIGIDQEELDMIWDRFYKSDKSRSKDKAGTGLGLAIVRNIINEHGQKVWVESKPGEGTAFTFTLERAYDAPDEQV